MASLVGYTMDVASIRIPPQRNAFYAAGRYWVFYCKPGTDDLIYRTSTDGLAWTAETGVAPLPVPNGANYDLFFDGTYIHYARNISYAGGRYRGLMYRRGLPQAAGTISWSAVEQTALADGNVADDLSLIVDSNGYPWIGYADAADFLASVTKSSTNDGTWTTAGGYPFVLDNTIEGCLVFLVPQTGGKLCAILYVVSADTRIRARFYDGAWAAVEFVTAVGRNQSRNTYGMLCATSIDDEIHLVYHPAGENTIQYLHGHAGSWSGETEIEDASHVAGYTSPVISHHNNLLYVFWLHSNEHVYYRKYNGGWEAVVDWVDETADTFPHDRLNQCFFESFGLKIGLTYQTKATQPHKVRFAFLEAPAAGWTGKISGVTNPAKVMGVDVANIAKVKGVA